MSGTKDKKIAPAGDPEDTRRKRSKDKLIRLDDLIPKENVVGGRNLLFGASHSTQTTNPKKNH